MSTGIDGTLTRLRAVHGGDPWHGPSTRALLEGVTAGDAAAHPVAGAHSIWELVRHMTAWCQEAARRAAGGFRMEPEIGDWPAVTDTSDAAWQAAIRDLDAANEALVEAAARLSPEALARLVGEQRVPALGTGVTVSETLEGVVAHHAYHAGQIALLKRALAAARR